VAFVKHLVKLNHKVAVLKPIAAGAIFIDQQLKNDDAMRLLEVSNVGQPYDDVNPIIFQQAIAPHIAAFLNDKSLSVEDVYQHCLPALNASADMCIVEGAGGWLVPLNDNETMADLATKINLPVVLVVGMKLGCINHALLTIRSIQSYGLELSGWVANVLDEDMPELDNNIETLKRQINAPLMAKITASIILANKAIKRKISVIFQSQ